MGMFFSIVIPLYNKEPFVGKTLESVLRQRFEDFELIVVDDGSTDGSAAIVEANPDPRVRLIRQQNGGMSVARNRGISEAQAEYIVLLDADDDWHPDFLAELHALIAEFPGTGVFCGAWKASQQGGKEKTIRWDEALPEGARVLREDYLERLSTGESPIHSSNVCVTRSLFEKVGMFKKGVVPGQDIDMWIRLTLESPVAHVNKVLMVHHRGITGRISNAAYPRYQELPFQQELLAATERQEFSTERRNAVKEVIAKFNYLAAIACLRAGEAKASRHWSRKVKTRKRGLYFRNLVARLLGLLPGRIGRRIVYWRESLQGTNAGG